MVYQAQREEESPRTLIFLGFRPFSERPKATQLPQEHVI